VQFTIGEEAPGRLLRLQTLLRREIPDGDPAAIFDRATVLLLERVERRKLGARGRRSPRPIRRAADAPALTNGTPVADIRTPPPSKGEPSIPPPIAADVRTPPLPSRHVPHAVRGAVWERDGGQCAYVSPTGTRCVERAFLEFHHVWPYARRGAATLGNIALRCRGHNQYEAELAFGTGRPTKRTALASP